MGAIPDILSPSGPIIVIYLLLAFLAFSAFHRSNLNSFPGHFLARLSDVWISWHTARGTVNRAVHEAHKTYGMSLSVSSCTAQCSALFQAPSSASRPIMSPFPTVQPSSLYTGTASGSSSRSSTTYSPPSTVQNLSLPPAPAMNMLENAKSFHIRSPKNLLSSSSL